MKKLFCSILAFVMMSCSFAQAAIVLDNQNALIGMTISQQQDSSFKLLSASVVEEDNGFTCVETIHVKNSISNSVLETHAAVQTKIIRITHTWYRNGALICTLQIAPSFKFTGTSALVETKNMSPKFQQNETGSAYALGSLTTRDSNSASEKASITQIYTVCDKYSNVCTGTFRAYCTVDGVCTGNSESNNF